MTISSADIASAIETGSETRSGVSVNTNVALQVSAALCAGRVIAEGVAQMPLKIFEHLENGTKAEARSHPAWPLFHRQPNDWQSSFDFREQMTLHAVFTGNAIAVKNSVNGVLRELIPIVPDKVEIRQNARFGLMYRIFDKDGGHIGDYDPGKIFHLRGPSWSGFYGIDIVRTAREALGLTIELERSQGRMHARDRTPSGILTYKAGKLDQESLDKMSESWNATFGPGGPGGVAVLEKD
ncbi:MAG: phage portal protein, partial [Desulfocapsa sp.]